MIEINFGERYESKIINITEAYKLMEIKNAILVDVRSRQEYMEGHIRGSINIPLMDIEKCSFDRSRAIILYCNAGIRSKKAMRILKNKGFKDVYILEPIEIP